MLRLHGTRVGYGASLVTQQERICLQYRRRRRYGFDMGSGRSPGGGRGNPLPFLPGESHGQRSLLGYNPQGCKRSDRTRVTEDAQHWLRLILIEL